MNHKNTKLITICIYKILLANSIMRIAAQDEERAVCVCLNPFDVIAVELARYLFFGALPILGDVPPDISSNTKKVAFNQAVFSGRKTIPQTSKPGFDTNMAPGQSGAGWTEVFNELRAQLERVIDLHERDCEEKCDGVFLYGLLEKNIRMLPKN